MSSPSTTPIRKQPKQSNVDRPAKNTTLVNKYSKASNISNVTLARDVQRSAFASLTKIKPRLENKNSTSASVATRKRKPAKIYEPIRLPEDILTIQAHSASTPVTELPYLLIAAHIGALPTARQFYPTTSATNSPLTVFRDMFVMTIDVRGYKPSSVRLSTDGHLVIIECLQSEVPQVVFTQTGTVDANDQCVVDASPNLNEMPVHTSFNYVQHRVKLPEDFSEEGLKVGLDDVSGHVIITGRLVHNQKTDFPEAWNKNRVVRKHRGPIINTVSNANLNQEDARKLAAWNAVQGKSHGGAGRNDELGSTNLIGYGRKQWLEREGAKLRAIQHKALKENIRKLTELKNSPTPKPVTYNSNSALDKNQQNSKPFSKYKGGTDTTLVTPGVESRTSVKNISGATTLLENTKMRLEGTGKTTTSLMVAGRNREEAFNSTSILSLDTRNKESRPKVSFPPDLKYPSGKRRKKHNRNDADGSRSSLRKKSLQKIEPNCFRKNSRDVGKKKSKLKGCRNEDVSDDVPANGANQEGAGTADTSKNGPTEGNADMHDSVEITQVSAPKSISDPDKSQDGSDTNPKASQSSEKIFGRPESTTPSGATTPKTPTRNSQVTNNQELTVDSPQGGTGSGFGSKVPSPLGGSVTKLKGVQPGRLSSKPGTSNVSKNTSQTDNKLIELEEIRDLISRATDKDKIGEDAEDPIGKQDKAMWEALLSHAGVGKPTHSRDRDFKDRE